MTLLCIAVIFADRKRGVCGRTRRRRVGALASQSGQSYSPLSAAGLFTQALEVETTISHPYAADESSTTSTTSTATFRVYYTAPEVGVQHGATVFVCVHGAGYSGLSYARLAKSLVDLNRDVERQDGGAYGGENVGKIGVLAYDARGHGESRRGDGSGCSSRDATYPVVDVRLFSPQVEHGWQIRRLQHRLRANPWSTCRSRAWPTTSSGYSRPCSPSGQRRPPWFWSDTAWCGPFSSD